MSDLLTGETGGSSMASFLGFLDDVSGWNSKDAGNNSFLDELDITEQEEEEDSEDDDLLRQTYSYEQYNDLRQLRAEERRQQNKNNR